MDRLIESSLEDALAAYNKTIRGQAEIIEDIASVMVKAVSSGSKILLCGNGGSAADCQHIAAEFVNRFRKDRRPLAAMALTTDTSILTSIANDFSFEDVFETQSQAIGSAGDCLIAISTSGNSVNIIKALRAAREKGMSITGLTGRNGG